MKRLLVVLAILLSGCSTLVPVQQKFPDVPPELMQKCPDLELVPDGTTKLSIVLGTVVDNYSSYNECKAKLDSWIQWYNSQKQIYNSVK